MIAITMGDPAGIGPEIIMKCFTHPELSRMPLVVVGSFDVLEKARELLKLDNIVIDRLTEVEKAKFQKNHINILDIDNVEAGSLEYGKIQAPAGKAAFEYLKVAIELSLENKVRAIATAPLNKKAMHMAGLMYPGQTEILAEFYNTQDYAMLLYTERLKVIHVTTHIALRKVPEALNKKRIAKVIEIADDFLKRLGYSKRRIAVAGLNPHAGEAGLFGDEEQTEIVPAIEETRKKGITVDGPVPPDIVFMKANEGDYDIVVAMYHDQGHIAVKLLGFHYGVNVTAGLPTVRTSVDHGTAFDIAWKGIARQDSLTEAILLADKLLGH